MTLTPRTATNRVRTAARRAGLLDNVVTATSTETAVAMQTEVEVITKAAAAELAEQLRNTFPDVSVRNGLNIFTVIVKQPVG